MVVKLYDVDRDVVVCLSRVMPCLFNLFPTPSTIADESERLNTEIMKHGDFLVWRKNKRVYVARQSLCNDMRTTILRPPTASMKEMETETYETWADFTSKDRVSTPSTRSASCMPLKKRLKTRRGEPVDPLSSGSRLDDLPDSWTDKEKVRYDNYILGTNLLSLHSVNVGVNI